MKLSIEHYVLTEPSVEILYSGKEQNRATLLQASYSLMEEYCDQKYTYTIETEHWDYQIDELIQRDYTVSFQQWAEALEERHRQQMLEGFVTYCAEQCFTQPVYFFT